MISKQKVFTTVIKIPSWEAWVQRPSGNIKEEGRGVQTLKVRQPKCQMKVESIR